MLYDVMPSNKHWRILSSTVADAQRLVGHQSTCGSGVGDLPLHHLCFGFVLPFPLLLHLSNCLHLSSHRFSCFCSSYSFPTLLGQGRGSEEVAVWVLSCWPGSMHHTRISPVYRYCLSDSKLCPFFLGVPALQCFSVPPVCAGVLHHHLSC